MMARASELALTMVLAVAFSEALANPPEPAGEPARPAALDDVQDLIFFGKSRPIVLRLHLEVDGQCYEMVWRKAIDRLFKYIDVDGDGRLSETEGSRTGWLQQIANQAGIRMARSQGLAASPGPTIASTAGLATPDDLRAHLRPWFGPVQLLVARPNSQKLELLFEALDVNHDSSLSREECEAAHESLQGLDHDEDETIQLQEAQPYQNPFYGVARGLTGTQSADDPAFALLSASESRTRIVRGLLNRYDRQEKDHRLSRTELGMEPSTFGRADGDGDGGLDSDELVQYLREVEPDLEIEVRMFSRGQSKVEVVRSPKQRVDDSTQIRTTAAGGVILSVDLDQVELIPSGVSVAFNYGQIFTSQFHAADTDGNKYLDAKEIGRNALLNGDAFKLMDRNGDGKLFASEMNEFLDEDSSVSQSRTLLSGVDQGSSLFDVLDENRDRRLTIREQREVVNKISSWDRNGDGRVSQEEVPHSYQLSFGRGQPILLARLGILSTVNGTVQRTPSSTQGPTPIWFTRMDRNRDGDVSRREFLGTRSDFQRLDADHDGLLDRNEAAKAR